MRFKEVPARAQRQDCVKAEISGRLEKNALKGRRALALGDQKPDDHSSCAPEILCGGGRNFKSNEFNTGGFQSRCRMNSVHL